MLGVPTWCMLWVEWSLQQIFSNIRHQHQACESTTLALPRQDSARKCLGVGGGPAFSGGWVRYMLQRFWKHMEAYFTWDHYLRKLVRIHQSRHTSPIRTFSHPRIPWANAHGLDPWQCPSDTLILCMDPQGPVKLQLCPPFASICAVSLVPHPLNLAQNPPTNIRLYKVWFSYYFAQCSCDSVPCYILCTSYTASSLCHSIVCRTILL